MERALARDVRALIVEMEAAVDAVIVEGGHDREALERAGFSKPIYTCSETDGFVGFAKDVARQHDRIAILTDFDAEGKELNKELQEYIPGRKNERRWRKELGKLLTEHGRRDIESINNLLSR